MTPPDPHLVPKDPARWKKLARHLRDHPEAFDIALENLDRWEKWGRVHPAPLHEWRRRILEARSSPSAMDDLLPVPVEALPRILSHFRGLTT